MAGDLDQATSFLLHPFMQRVFADLGGAAGLPDGKVQPTISRLEKAGRNRPSLDLKAPTDRAALGNFIVKAAQDLKSPLPFLRHGAIAESWQQHRAKIGREHVSTPVTNAHLVSRLLPA